MGQRTKVKARVKLTKSGHYIVQYRNWLPWWSTHGKKEYGYDGGSWSVDIKYKTQEKAVVAMAELLMKHTKKNETADKAKIVIECTEKQVLEKLSEYLV